LEGKTFLSIFSEKSLKRKARPPFWWERPKKVMN